MEECGYAWPVRLHLCGVRGSTPVSGPDFVRCELDQIAKRFARAPLTVTVAAADQVIDL